LVEVGFILIYTDDDALAGWVEAHEIQPLAPAHPQLALYLPTISRRHLTRIHYLAESLGLWTLDLDQPVVCDQTIRRNADEVVFGVHYKASLRYKALPG
jgi:hypothetical protein